MASCSAPVQVDMSSLKPAISASYELAIRSTGQFDPNMQRDGPKASIDVQTQRLNEPVVQLRSVIPNPESLQYTFGAWARSLIAGDQLAK